MATPDTMFFGWPLMSDRATLSGGAWEPTLDVSLVQTELLAEAAVTIDADAASTVMIVDQGEAREISYVALCGHNMRSADQWRVRVGPNADGSDALFDSSMIDCWGTQWPVGLLPSGHPNATTRKYTDAQINTIKRDIVMIVPQVVGQFLRIDADVSANVDGFWKVGRLAAGPRYTPSYNFSIGAGFGFVDGTTVGKSMSQVRYYNVVPKGRSFNGAFTNLPDREAHAVLRDMMEELGQEGQLYFVQNPQDTEDLQRRTMLCNFRQLSDVQIAAAGYSSVPIVLDEVV